MRSPAPPHAQRVGHQLLGDGAAVGLEQACVDEDLAEMCINVARLTSPDASGMSPVDT
jgi:hypothetical protein